MLGKVAISADFDQVVVKENTPASIVLTGNLVFDWLDITQTGRDAVIERYKSELFGDDTIYKYNKKEFKSEYKDFLKDADYERHYMLTKNDVKETDDENLCGFYRGKVLISYAVQYKHDLRTVYYYDALGHLRYIDKFAFYATPYLERIEFRGTKEQWKKVRKIPGWISGASITNVKKIICKDGMIKL